MATTPNGVPYPSGNSIPDAAYWLQQLAEYVDATIAADTGWQPVEFATGWSEFSSSHRVRVRRVGKICHMKGAVARASGGLLTAVLQLPPGFGPGDGQEFIAAHVMSSGASYEIISTAGGAVSFPYTQGSLPATGGAWPVTATWMVN